jgi:HEAT repeat protein
MRLAARLEIESSSRVYRPRLQVRTGAAVFLSGMAQHLPKDDPKIPSIVAILQEILNTPSSVVQETAATALASIAPKLAADESQVSDLVKHFLTSMTDGELYSVRRGAAFGLAGLVKGLGISALKRQGIMDAIKAAVDAKSAAQAKEGGLMAVECLCTKLGRMFEPYIISILPVLLAAFGDPKAEVRGCWSATSCRAQICTHVMRAACTILCKLVPLRQL